MAKYDFYKKPPKSKKDIREYLTTWLESSSTSVDICIENEIWKSVSGFRRGFCVHSVMMNVMTGEYAFHAADDFDQFPNMGKSNTYDDLINEVVDKYAILWNIKE